MRIPSLSPKTFSVLTITAFTVYILSDLAGEIIGNLGANYQCLKYIGCTGGFFGFDAIEHLLCGFAAVLVIVLWMHGRPKYSLLNGRWLRNAFMLICIVALIAVFWEFMECAHDYFRIIVLHERLFSVTLHINALDQPSNFDTMGDLMFNLLGAIIGTFFINVRGINDTGKTGEFLVDSGNCVG